jgi:hypothetical protein
MSPGSRPHPFWLLARQVNDPVAWHVLLMPPLGARSASPCRADVRP